MIKLIAAYDENMGVGINNTLPWHIPEDLKHFKDVTTGKNIIMGRSTFESLPRILPNRKHIVLTTKGLKIEDPNLITVSSLDNCLEILKNLDNKESVVIGGNKIWEIFLPYVDELYITKVKGIFNVDTYFPQWNENLYTKTILEENEKFLFLKYTK